MLTKYYPPDFDPSKITRTPRHLRPTGPRLLTVRLMAPFGMKCTACGEYIYKGRKFNARKETTEEKYLNIPIYRFYIRCTRCSGEITFKTDPKNMDYTCERGAKRNFEIWREGRTEEVEETDEQRLDRLEREEAEELEVQERNAMEELEQKMMDSKKEMQVADALDNIRTRNAQIERGERAGEEAALATVKDLAAEERERLEREDEESARRAFESRNAENVDLDTIEGRLAVADSQQGILPSTFTRIKKVKRPGGVGLIKKATTQAATKAALVGYGSDSE